VRRPRSCAAARATRGGSRLAGAGVALAAGAAATLAAAPPAPAPAPGAGSGPVRLTEAEIAFLETHPVIRLAPYADYPPVEFVDERGVHRGMVADYLALVEQLVPIRFERVRTESWQEILDRARVRQVDLIGLAAETPERRAYLLFTSPYLDLPAVIIARDTVREGLEPEDLGGMRVSVVRGYAVEEYLRERHPGLLFDPVPDTLTGLRKVAFGMSDAFVSDLAVASHYIQEQGITNLHVVGESGYVYRMGFASRSDWPELRGILEKALARIPPRQRTEIFDRWIGLAYEPGAASRTVLLVLGGTVAAVLLLAGAVLAWNGQLRRRVARRTAELDAQLMERRRAAEALRQSEERIRMIIGAALDAVITMDAAGRVTGWSGQAERTFGWSRGEAMDRTLAELIIPKRYRESHAAGLDRFLRTGEGPVLNRHIEITGLHRDGREIPVELAIAPIRRGGTYEFSAFVRDITARKQAEAELERHRNHLEELVAQRTSALQDAKNAAETAEHELASRVRELEAALGEVRKLRGLLPVCSYCHRVREGEEYTKSVLAYLTEHADARFSHGVCPECYEKHVRPQLERME
jgi:PAS domain S-box-containing protein